MESISATLVTFGAVLLLASWIQLIIVSFEEDYTWGLCSVFLPPFSYFYSLFAWQKAKSCIWLAVLGCALLWAA